jgi:hypothetical protein
MRSLPAVPFVVALLALLPATTACGPVSSGGPPPAAEQDSGSAQGLAFPPTGNQYVDARRCPACHQGADPKTTGFLSGAIEPIPGEFGSGVVLYGPNLTPDAMTGLGNWSDDQIQTAILYGIDNLGERLCPQMQHFPDMQMAELQSILGYLHALAPVVHQTTRSKCPPLKY